MQSVWDKRQQDEQQKREEKRQQQKKTNRCLQCVFLLVIDPTHKAIPV